VVADINEFTHVELAGWNTGLGEAADLEVSVQVENWELSTYSPYLAELSGVHLESGQLDKEITATAEQGALLGKIQLELDDMAFRPSSKEEAERVSGTIRAVEMSVDSAPIDVVKHITTSFNCNELTRRDFST